ncbi:MAG: cysteine desulfurase [Deltaproteobacteria bacterium]|nr:cysteine desulfurase [Deltaproteobacteria bacterium]
MQPRGNDRTSRRDTAFLSPISRDRGARGADSTDHCLRHHLSERATLDYEKTRTRVQKFLNAKEAREILFVRGTTEAINLVAQTFGRQKVHAGEEVVISLMEHHSNIVPWQMLCEEVGARLRVIPITDDGELRMDEFEKLLTPKTKLVSVAHISNALGTINPVKEIIRLAHEKKIPVLLDGAQAAPHLRVDVQELDPDFYTFSGHKLYGPTGIGVLYGKAELLESMPPYQGGGDMISAVTFEKTTYNVIPHKFEAGTPHIAGVIGLGAAIDYLQGIGLQAVEEYEKGLLKYATEAMLSLPRLKIIGTARNKAAVISFIMDEVHPHDIGTVLDQEGIAIRTGHHCAMPLMERLRVPATARASFALYNTREDVNALIRGLKKVAEVFG